MIDAENAVFNTVSSALKMTYSGIYVTGEYTPAPPRFPAVSLMESDNRVATKYSSSSTIERAVSTMYEANIYSNKVSGKKTEAKAIANALDEVMAGLGFTRTMRNQIPNFNDAKIYRIVCRYEGTIIPNDDGKYYIHTK